MSLVVTILTVVLTVALVVSSLADLAKVPSVVEALNRLGVPASMLPVLASIKLLGAVGLVAGLWSTTIQVAAGAAVGLYFAMAVAMHVRAGDSRSDTGAAMVLLSVSVAHLLTALAA